MGGREVGRAEVDVVGVGAVVRAAVGVARVEGAGVEDLGRAQAEAELGVAEVEAEVEADVEGGDLG